MDGLFSAVVVLLNGGNLSSSASNMPAERRRKTRARASALVFTRSASPMQVEAFRYAHQQLQYQLTI